MKFTDPQGVTHAITHIECDSMQRFFRCTTNEGLFFLHAVDIKLGEGETLPIQPPPNMFGDVQKFHRKFGIGYDGPPRMLPLQIFKARTSRILEELAEIYQAYACNDLAKVADGHIDLIYFLLGNMDLHGVDANEAWNRVQDANMVKRRANPGEGKHLPDGTFCDIVKPEGWKAPDLTDLCHQSSPNPS